MSNVERLRQAYQAWHDRRGKSTDVWLDLLADHFKLRSLGDGAQELEFSAPRDGKDQMRGYFASLERDWEMLFFHADEFVADGDRVVMIGPCGWKHRRTGKQNERRWSRTGGSRTAGQSSISSSTTRPSPSRPRGWDESKLN